MEIHSPAKIQAVESFHQKKKDFVSDEHKTLSNIIQSLKGALNHLDEWVQTYPLKDKENLKGARSDLINVSEEFVAAYKGLQNFKTESQNIAEIETALLIESNILHTHKIIAELSNRPFWKFNNFSFVFLFQIAHKTPPIDLKGMILHLFNLVSFVEWEKISHKNQTLIEQLA